MTANLHLANNTQPADLIADLASLWVELLDDAPRHDEMVYVTFSIEQAGTITAYFADPVALVKWAEHLGGLVFTREHIAGRSYRVTAQGQVIRGDRSAVVVLKANLVDRSAA